MYKMYSGPTPSINEVMKSHEVMLRLMKVVRDWWAQEGYKHHVGIVFDDYGYLIVTLAVSAEARSMKEQEAFVDDLRKRGYTIGGNNAYEAFIVDNESNRNLIKAVIKERFPSAKILQWENNCQVGADKEEFLLSRVNLRIQDITDVCEEDGL